ncbi:hypothetical protein D9619_004035 [Psilocybe cf. subviscida]|uniref:Anaphase-promoting complex subunit 4 WD40 domain-containing protein n=1 Tax=Psilocybe cf. subviscida TaxID=2480587 RepID=A0A8H5F845_9AGAR|nr:hypothetical protein D9619_004035 [Psilocybe cf. subviscida]
MTTTVATLEAHTNEVWDIQWSHDGAFLASASSDKSAIIWRKAERSSHTAATSMQDWSVHLVLNDDIFAVGRLAWSPDDKVLLTSSEHLSKMWDTETGSCIRILEEHEETVTSICWLPDGTGFVTGSLDRKVIVWDKDGRVRDVWDRTPIRIIDFAITPDETRLVAVGLEYKVRAYSPGSEFVHSGHECRFPRRGLQMEGRYHAN